MPISDSFCKRCHRILMKKPGPKGLCPKCEGQAPVQQAPVLVQVLVNCQVKAANEAEASARAGTVVRALTREHLANTGVKVLKVVDTLWKCPECGRVISWSYDSMADVGNPLCVGDGHDEEMDRV
jgi:predicted RNA-binding Zn-ribbon protein involved in translation (DUF1610 family)